MTSESEPYTTDPSGCSHKPASLDSPIQEQIQHVKYNGLFDKARSTKTNTFGVIPSAREDSRVKTPGSFVVCLLHIRYPRHLILILPFGHKI